MALAKLTKIQLNALDELYGNGGDELAVQEKFNIKYSVWQKWMSDYYFTSEIDIRLATLQRQTDIMLAKFKPMAMALLMGLCQSQNEETSRKACAELLCIKFSSSAPIRDINQPPEPDEQITDEMASKILAVLAEEKRKQRAI